MISYVFCHLNNQDEGNFIMAIEALQMILEEDNKDLIDDDITTISLKLAGIIPIGTNFQIIEVLFSIFK